MKDQKILDAATKLVMAMGRAADTKLPGEIKDVVKTYSKVIVACAFIPIPGVDAIAQFVVLWKMYTSINKKVGISSSENIGKIIVSGVLTNILRFVAISIFGSILKIIPGIGTLGGIVIEAFFLYGALLASGVLYLQALTSMYRRNKR